MTFEIPKDLQAEWDQIVERDFKGDHQTALREALSNLILEHKRKVPKSGLFDDAMGKVVHRQENMDDILSDSLSDALTKMKKRKERGLPI